MTPLLWILAGAGGMVAIELFVAALSLWLLPGADVALGPDAAIEETWP